MKKLLLSSLLGLLFASTAISAVPSTLNVQGRLLNSGNPMTGTHPAVFSFFDAPAGGSPLWTENSTLDITGGLFTATLGIVTPVPTILFDASPRWLEVSVDGTTLSPRLELTTSAYAFRAQHADTASYALNAPPTGDNLWSTDGTNVWRNGANVGIGTATPVHPLEAYGSQPGQVGYFHSNATSGTNYGVDAGAQGLGATTNIGGYFYASGATNNYALIVPPGLGNTGLGTLAPDQKLTVVVPTGTNDIARFRSDNGNCDVVIGAAEDQVASIYTLAGQGLSIGVNNSSGPIRITSAGDVGIGTSVPRDKFHVAGGSAANYFNTAGAALGNGSVYAHLQDNGLQFISDYGYAVGEEFIDFQSNYNPAVGGQGTLARITGFRNPDDYDAGRGRMRLSVRSGSGIADVAVLDPSGMAVNGNLNVTGTKCREVDTPQFGKLFFNAVESANALFSLEGEGRLRNGRCQLELDPRWLAGVTIDEQHPMQVWITFYGEHGEYFVERGRTGFTLRDASGSNAAFGWKVEARQRGYENLYLDRPEATAAK